jgi:hypothetical protein
VQPVAWPAVVKLRSGPAVRARIVRRHVPGTHAKKLRNEIAQRDPAGQEVPAQKRIRNARGTRALRRIEEGLAVRSDVSKTNGPDGDSGNGDGPSVPARL